VVFSSGETHQEQRKVAMEILGKFGVGKNILAEKVLEEVGKVQEEQKNRCL
jgi:hypothetical protein